MEEPMVSNIKIDYPSIWKGARSVWLPAKRIQAHILPVEKMGMFLLLSSCNTYRGGQYNQTNIALNRAVHGPKANSISCDNY